MHSVAMFIAKNPWTMYRVTEQEIYAVELHIFFSFLSLAGKENTGKQLTAVVLCSKTTVNNNNKLTLCNAV